MTLYSLLFCVSPREQRRQHRSEEHTSELQLPCNIVCRLLLENKNRLCPHATVPGPRARREQTAAERCIQRAPHGGVCRLVERLRLSCEDAALHRYADYMLHRA